MDNTQKTHSVMPYDSLSRAGRLRRVHRLAQEAISCYDLDDPKLQFFAANTNLLYQVTTSSGRRLMLRMASPGWRTFEDLRSEAMWLQALASDTSIGAPGVIPARDGRLVLPMSSPEVRGVRNATLMTWVPGRSLKHHLTPAYLAKMGALFAELHNHGATWFPPEGFTTRRFEHWLSRGEPNLIAGSGASDQDYSTTEAAPPPEPPAIPGEHRDLLMRTDAVVEATYQAIDRADLRVIHCDLWHENIKVHQGALRPFDFEDTIWGFRSHDIAMAMLDLLETTGDTAYYQLLASFRQGYEAHMPWPDDPIEPLQIGRLLWKLNWVACHWPQGLREAVERHVPVLAHFMQTGEVIEPPEI